MTSMRQFIKDNRAELDECIQRACPGAAKNDEERACGLKMMKGSTCGQERKVFQYE